MKPRSRRTAGLTLAAAALPLLLIAAGCATSEVKRYEIEVRVPSPGAKPSPPRARLVLVAADALQEPNLSRSEEYVLRERAPLAGVLLRAAAEWMRAAGIEPLEAGEAERSSGRLVVVLTRLETKIEGSNWFASAALRAERTDGSGRVLGRWETIGRGAHQDSRIFAGASGLAMGKAIGEALNRLPWADIAEAR